MNGTTAVVLAAYGTTRHKPPYFEKVFQRFRDKVTEQRSLCIGREEEIDRLVMSADPIAYGRIEIAQQFRKFLQEQAVILRDASSNTFFLDVKRGKHVAHCINRSTDAGTVSPESRRSTLARLKQLIVTAAVPPQESSPKTEVQTMTNPQTESNPSTPLRYRLFMLADEQAVWELFRPVNGQPVSVKPQEDAMKQAVLEELLASSVTSVVDGAFVLRNPFDAYLVTLIQERKEFPIPVEYLQAIRELQRSDWRPEPGVAPQQSFIDWFHRHPELSKSGVNTATLVAKLWHGPAKDGRQSWGIVTSSEDRSGTLVAVRGFEYWDFKEGGKYKPRPRGSRTTSGSEVTSELPAPVAPPRVDALIELLDSVKLELFQLVELERLEGSCHQLITRLQSRKKVMQAEMRATLERELAERKANVEKLMKAATEEEARMRALEEQLKVN